MTAATETIADIAGKDAPEVIYAPIAQVHESKTNPRRFFDKGKLEELAESIGKRGVYQPGLARPMATGGYELVFGARRYRATKIAGLKTFPIIVREMTDSEVLEAQVIENLQREDVHPLEEADGYDQLMKNHGYTADTLAAKIGKSRAYVYARLKLLALGKAGRDAFFDGKLNPSTALLVARIPDEKLQEKATKEITAPRWAGADAMSFRDAARHVQENYMLKLSEAPFNTKDPALVPEAGACTACPHRTGNQKEVFGDVKGGDVCTSPRCYQGKVEANWKVKSDAAKKVGLRVLGEKEAAPALTRYGREGEFARIDADAPGRYEPYSKLIPKGQRPPAAAIARDEDGNVVELFKRADLNKAAKVAGPKPQRFDERKQRMRDPIRDRAEVEGPRRAMAAFVAFVEKKGTSKALLHALALAAIGAAWADTAGEVVHRRGLEKAKNKQAVRQNAEQPLIKLAATLTDRQLMGLLAEILATQTRTRWGSSAYPKLMALAKVDPKKIEAAVLKELRTAAAEKKKAAEKKAAAKSKGKATPKTKTAKPATAAKTTARKACAREECTRPAVAGKRLCEEHTETPLKRGVCKHCGCTNEKPCEDENGDAACGWTNERETECTACVPVGKG